MAGSHKVTGSTPVSSREFDIAAAEVILRSRFFYLCRLSQASTRLKGFFYLDLKCGCGIIRLREEKS
jgi:hypothetical protein